MFRSSSFFKNEVIIKSVIESKDFSQHPPLTTRTETLKSLMVHMDTPRSSAQLDYHKLGVTVDLFMFLPYGIDVKKTDVIIYEGTEYVPTGTLEDQGGRHLVNRLPLKLRGS
ncbi:hypothetical protein [Macrococcus capreoli]|uniref:hypothetical protein n=1 Tax=Macrococcus capreoli TaxID=2982690 RepID=UPI003EE6BC9C